MEVIKPSSRSITVTANDDSQTGSARRQAFALASSLDFSELRCGQLGIVVTELARNLCLHGGGGEILLTPWEFDGESGMDVLALDSGPGIADIGAAMADGYSTGGTAGTGLGAVERLSNTFQIYSRAGKGTAVFSRILKLEDSHPVPSEARQGVINVPIPGETLCGDGWTVHKEPGRTLFLMADGLGHGPIAHEAANNAVETFYKNLAHTPKQILEAMHLSLASTRGAAIAIAEILPESNVLNFVGSGNISASIHDGGKPRSLVSMNGTPGHTMGALQTFSYEWGPNATLLMHSDGLSTRWNMDAYPGLVSRHPTLIAGVLYRDFYRRRDDVTILVSGS